MLTLVANEVNTNSRESVQGKSHLLLLCKTLNPSCRDLGTLSAQFEAFSLIIATGVSRIIRYYSLDFNYSKLLVDIKPLL